MTVIWYIGIFFLGSSFADSLLSFLGVNPITEIEVWKFGLSGLAVMIAGSQK